MRYAVIVLLVGALVASAGPHGVRAETPTPSATATATAAVTATPTPVNIQLRFVPNAQALIWDAIAGAARYHLLGTATASEVNAVDVCLPAASPQTMKIDIDVEVAATTQQYAISLPSPAPGDVWFIQNIRANIDAQNAGGTTIATGGIGFSADAFCAEPVGLPATGSGTPTSRSASTPSMLLVASSAIVLLAGGLALGRRRR